jgi:hypothetical protein
MAGTSRWLVPLAPLTAGALGGIVVGRGRLAWLVVVGSTAVFGLAGTEWMPKLAALGLGILGAAYAIGRWTDVHATAADAPPDLLMYGSLAAGFVLVYRRPTF